MRITRGMFGNSHTHFHLAAKFDALAYNPYGNGLVAACEIAKRFGLSAFSAIEFGVAGGNGLIRLCRYSRILSRHYQIDIRVFGFDSGSGLPEPCDYRDAPWLWISGDFPPSEVKSKLSENGS